MARHINALGIEHLKRWEGVKLEAYRDVAGIWTIGYGHTSAAGAPKVTPQLKITQAKAEEILKRDLRKFEAAVERLVKVELTDNQFATLVSFVYNVGEGAFAKSTLLRKLNKGDYDAVPGELGKWVKAGGRTVKGLANRRAAEAGLWAKGAYVSSQDAPAKPEKVKAILTPEALGTGGAVLGAVATSASSPGPLQWALAVAILAGIAIAAYFFVQRIRERNP